MFGVPTAFKIASKIIIIIIIINNKLLSRYSPLYPCTFTLQFNPKSGESRKKKVFEKKK